MSAPFQSADFFAGSGLVTLGLEPYFQSSWANDISVGKERIFRINHPGKRFLRADISDISGKSLPPVDLAWASFPCQDLSLAGNLNGIDGDRSGLVWEWLRILAEMNSPPTVVVAENVYGLLTSNKGRDYQRLHQSLSDLGYQVGALVVDAFHFIPQSRVRVFVVGYHGSAAPAHQHAAKAGWCHPKALQALAADIPDFIYWNLPQPGQRTSSLKDIIDRDVDVPLERSAMMARLIPAAHYQKLLEEWQADPLAVFAGYRRTRTDGQRLEVRFDQQSGCLRTAKGGSSKQILIYQAHNKIVCRFMSPREAARAMGAPDSFQLAGTSNEAYTAMGDAVAVPVTRHLAAHLLAPLIQLHHATAAHRQPA